MEKASSDKMFNNLRDFYLYLSFLREFKRRRMGSCQQQQLAQRTDGEHHHEHRRHESGSSENVIVECVVKNNTVSVEILLGYCTVEIGYNETTVYLISCFSFSALFVQAIFKVSARGLYRIISTNGPYLVLPGAIISDIL